MFAMPTPVYAAPMRLPLLALIATAVLATGCGGDSDNAADKRDAAAQAYCQELEKMDALRAPISECVKEFKQSAQPR